MTDREKLKDRLRGPLCRRLGVEVPVFQAGMGFVARAPLAAAVSAAGGLGVIGAGSTLSGADLRDDIRAVRAITDRPFGVDILFATMGASGDQAVRYTDAVQEMIDAVLEEKVPVLISGLGSPGAVIRDAHNQGIFVMSVVGAVRHAKRAVADGVDGIIATGSDGGGHVGQIGTAALVPAVRDAVNVPMLAGGGLADGRGLVAAMALGAEGVWMGTRFIATTEATAHDNYKRAIIETDTAGTVVTRAHSGKPCRLIRNDFTDYWAAREDEIQPFPLQVMAVGNPASVLGRHQGDVANGVLPAGQSAGLIESVKGAAEVVDDIINEAGAVLARMGL
ncbi:MAG: nitronate monooxygenase [Proteobacteria bacterium]|nr:nitronate monooxygenase [Pseudomonadota bacterium]